MKWAVYIRLPGLAARVEQAAVKGPVAVTKQGRIVDVTAAAARRGLVPGLSLPAARAVCPDVVFCPYREGNYLQQAETAWDIYARHTPRVEPDGPAGAFLELLAADVRLQVEQIVAAVRVTLQLEPRAGVAVGKLVARIAAGQADPIRIVPAAAVEAFLAPLPVAELWRLDRRRRQALERLGFTIGDLARLPETELVRRFGPDGRLLAAWSRGRDNEPVRPLYPPRRWQVEVERDGGEGMESVLGRLAGELWQQLEAEEQGAVELTLECGGRQLVRHLTRPPASAAALTRILAQLVAGEEPLRLRAVVTGRDRNWRQLTLAGSPREQLERVLEQLRHRHGEAVRRGAGPEERRERLLRLFDPFRLSDEDDHGQV